MRPLKRDAVEFETFSDTDARIAALISATPVAEGALQRLIESAPSAIEFRKGSLRSDAESVAWINRVPTVSQLWFHDGTVMPHIADVSPERRQMLFVWSRRGHVLTASDVDGTTTLHVGDARMIEADAGALATVEHLELGRVRSHELATGDSSSQLRFLKLRGMRQIARFHWHRPPARLERVQVDDLVLDSVEALGKVDGLKAIVVDNGRVIADGPALDLRPLVGCPRLEWIDVAANLPVTGLAEFVRANPYVRVCVARGFHDAVEGHPQVVERAVKTRPMPRD